MARDNDLGAVWARFAALECRGYSPLYERICHAVAGDQDTLDLVATAPPPGQQPNVLLAAVHDLLLGGLDHPLAEVYAGRSDADAGLLFLDVCRNERTRLEPLLASRRTQTNECGRSAAIVPALRWASARLGEPVGLVDVGASAGVNLLCDRYAIDYGSYGRTGPEGAAVRIDCTVVGGTPPIEPAAPAISARIGLDRAPVDLDDDVARRWLMACVWPDTGRLERTAAALDLTRRECPPIVRGDAVAGLPDVLAGLPASPACVLTTWTMAYLSPSDRSRFVAALTEASAVRPIAWLSAEGPGVAPLIDLPPLPAHDQTVPSVLGGVLFVDRNVDAHLLGFTHPHGRWLDWRA